MVQQSQNVWQSATNEQGEHSARAPSVADWMRDVLGEANPVRPAPRQQSAGEGVQASGDLQSRLAAIARNIQTLEARVAGDQQGTALATPPQAAASSTPSSTSPAAALDPIEALRRRKQQLDGGAQQNAAPQAQAAPPVHHEVPANHEPPAELPKREAAPVPAPPQVSADLLERLVARLDDQFARLSDAVGDVRSLAQTSAADQVGLRESVHALQARLDAGPAQGEALAPTPAGPALGDLSEQVRAVQDAISAMPKPEAIRSLEEGYHHVLARLDALKGVGAHDGRIDALYGEVTGLREVLDSLGSTDTAALVGEMRGMIERLERESGTDADRITQALENVQKLARSATQDPSFINEAMGAVVERLVALEARIEALASGSDESAVTQRLDAIQSQMSRLSTFQDEARGLTSALDTIRQEMRSAGPAVDMSGMEERFSALDRIEEMTGGYAAQVAELSARLGAIDTAFASHGEIAREVASLSAQLTSFKSALPVHEIEHALLDLTGRVTALQEDTSAERLGMAVRALGERVESCLKSIPRTDAIIAAVEARIDSGLSGAVAPILSRMDLMDDRLDGIQRAISAADAPLIDHMSQRLEGLIAAMPSARADDALAALETQLAEINRRQSAAGIVSREDVRRLHDELARARASVELGANRDLQLAIVDQVRHLAQSFDVARASGDAAMLPEIEQQIEDLADRVQALGLFDAPTDTPTPTPQLEALHGELAALRANASDQDLRMQNTLESVRTALETVIRRMNALEIDEKAAERLAEEVSAVGQAPANLKDLEKALTPRAPRHQVIPTQPRAEAPPLPLQDGHDDDDSDALDDLALAGTREPVDAPASPDTTPEPGDAQTLLRQLSGAMNPAMNPGMNPAAELPARPSTRGAQARRTAPRSPQLSSGDAESQRASFIAAARRAAQAAALQAGGGRPQAPANAAPASLGTGADMAAQLARKSAPQDSAPVDSEARIEPQVENPSQSAARPSGLPGDQPAAEAAPKPEATPIQQLGGAAKNAREEQSKKKAKEEKRQQMISRAMLVALVLFTVGLGLFVMNLIMPGERSVPAPVAVEPAPAAEPAAALPADATQGSAPAADPVREVGDVAATAPTEPVDAQLATTAEAAAPTLPSGTADALTEQLAFQSPAGTGFERDRGPVMNQTPQADVSAADDAFQPATLAAGAADASSLDAGPLAADESLPPPDNDLGPLLNLPRPALPPATADALPEAIGPPRLRVAAASGDVAAAFEIANRYMEGRFIPQDLAAAAHWYGRAADQGLAPAAYRLGAIYEQGRGVDRDRDAAIAWYESAALGGNPRAMHNLAVMAAEGAGQTPDFARAAGWFIPAANRGLADSQFNLAVLFARGMGVERDLMESYKWFALAASAGDSEAVNRRDEVAGVLGEQALALARARVENWRPVPVEPQAVDVAGPAGGWDDALTQASATTPATAAMIAQAQALLAARGYDAGPADGVAGPRTGEAVRAFRQSAGLGDSRQIDQALLDALRAGTAL